MMCLHIYQKALMACYSTFVVNREGVLKVTGSHIHFRNSAR